VSIFFRSWHTKHSQEVMARQADMAKQQVMAKQQLRHLGDSPAVQAGGNQVVAAGDSQATKPSLAPMARPPAMALQEHMVRGRARVTPNPHPKGAAMALLLLLPPLLDSAKAREDINQLPKQQPTLALRQATLQQPQQVTHNKFHLRHPPGDMLPNLRRQQVHGVPHRNPPTHGTTQPSPQLPIRGAPLSPSPNLLPHHGQATPSLRRNPHPWV